MKKGRWVVIANGSRARFFKMHSAHHLEEADSFVHTNSRLHGKDFTTDKAGCTSEVFGGKHRSSDPIIDPKKQEALVFAKRVANHMDKLRIANGVDRFYIAASPSFLGMLRQFMTPQTCGMIELEVSKDMTGLGPESIPKYFVF